MFAIRRILTKSVNITIRATTWQRCYCNPSNKRFVDDETSNRKGGRGTYKSVHDERPNSHTESTQQNHTTNDDEQNQQSKSNTNSGKNTPNDEKNLMVRGSFENISQKSRNTFLTMVQLFETRDVHRRNHVEFIYAALKNMREYGVHRDLAVYKALLDVMPKGKFIPTNLFQAEFNHYPKQQQCIIDLLEQMEENGVMPDYEIEDMLLNIFGKYGHATVRFWRMMYWIPKFKNLSPWLLPNPIPDDAFELAKLAVAQMCTVDVQSTVKTFDSKTVESSIDKSWIVSGQSPDQQKLLQNHPIGKSVQIEGPYLIWLRDRSINYFTLVGDAVPDHLFKDDEDEDDVSDIPMPAFLNPFGKKPKPKNKVALKRSIHQQDDGTIYAICATQTSTKDSLLSWVRLLEQNGNPNLANIPVLFKFKSPVNDKALVVVNSNDKNNET